MLTKGTHEEVVSKATWNHLISNAYFNKTMLGMRVKGSISKVSPEDINEDLDTF